MRIEVDDAAGGGEQIRLSTRWARPGQSGLRGFTVTASSLSRDSISSLAQQFSDRLRDGYARAGAVDVTTPAPTPA
ncbi:MAG TPA: hypothetical protein DGT21_04350, partial [Armatimonadetes bacterium]|nr:hypothetical protein [Armatimonadota bacterium]